MRFWFVHSHRESPASRFAFWAVPRRGVFGMAVAMAGLLLMASGCQVFQKGGKGGKTLFGRTPRAEAEEDLSEEVLDPLGARDSRRLLLDDLAPSQIATTLKVRGLMRHDEQKGAEELALGKQIFEQASARKNADPDGNAYQKMFVEAANHFRKAGALWPDSEIEEEASFFEGESYFFADRYVQANRAFEKLIANYSGTRYLDMAENRRFSIALYWLELADRYWGPDLTDPKRPKTGLAAEARRILHRIRIDDPTGKLADDATLALGKAFLKAKRYYEAADTLEDLRNNYPGSRHLLDAQMLELQARLSAYQGPEYDDTPLRKADELMKAIVRQFPQQSAEQREYLEKQAGLIRTEMARRDYAIAQYYEARGENRAARYHYEQIAQKYGETRFGKEVQERIAQLAKLPDEPEQQGKWLVDLFPSDKKEKPIIAAGDNETVFR